MIKCSTTVHEGNCDTMRFQLLGKINKIQLQLIATEERMAAETFQAVMYGNTASQQIVH